jgi:hypothetical protein
MSFYISDTTYNLINSTKNVKTTSGPTPPSATQLAGYSLARPPVDQPSTGTYYISAPIQALIDGSTAVVSKAVVVSELAVDISSKLRDNYFRNEFIPVVRQELPPPPPRVTVFYPPPPLPPLPPPIDIFLSKIRFGTPSYSSDETSQILIDMIGEDNDDLLKAVFALEKAHFSAILYLAVEKLIDTEDIRALIEMKYETRNDLLLNYLKREPEDIYVFRNFIKIMSDLMGTSLTKNTNSVFNSVSVPSINVDTNIELFEYCRGLINKYNNEDPFSLLPLSDSINTDIILMDLGPVLDLNREALTITSLKEEDSDINVNTKKFFSNILNDSYVDIIKNLYDNRFIPNYSISESLVNLTIKSAAEFTYDSETLQSNYFIELSKVYDTGIVEPFNFEYLNDDILESLMNNIFPSSSTFDKDSDFYITRRLVNFEQNINTYNELSYTDINKDSLFPTLLALEDNKILAKDNGEIVHFGKKSYTRIVMDTIYNALKEYSLNNYKYDEIDKLTFTQITAYLNDVKSDVLEFVDESFEDGLYTESESTFMIFFKDIFSDYIEYLKNNSITTPFKPKLSATGIKKYKLLNAVQQTFMFLPELIKRIRANRQYKTFEQTLLVGHNEYPALSYVKYLRGAQL